MAARLDTAAAISRGNAVRPTERPRYGLIFALLISLVGGITSPLLGLVLSVVHALVPGDARFAAASMVFTFISIPLLFAGAHLMDVFDRHQR
ncbi:MAG: hypothetical protein IPM59_08180 [Chloracidobacterium sp.]|nr:hypothetical protein [Chloracidobacterium sp.]